MIDGSTPLHATHKPLRYWEDFSVGDKHLFGHYPVTADEIKAFAGRYDPQPFHLDEQAGAKSAMGVFCASGWHTAAMAMRMMVDWLHTTGAAQTSLGSPGVDTLRWLRPVVPGETLSMQTEVIDKKPSSSRPDLGSVHVHYVVMNQHHEQKMHFVGIGLFKRRPNHL